MSPAEDEQLRIANLLKDETARLHEVISRATRRLAIMNMAARKLRLGYTPAVVVAEVEAQGEMLPEGIAR